MRYFGVSMILWASLLTAPSLAARAPALFNDLELGRETIGFETLFVRDPARPWRNTRPFGGAFEADVDGRPLQINLWYPAIAGSGSAMRYGHYADQDAPSDFAILAQVARKRSGETLGGFPKDIVPQLLAQPVAAHRSARPKAARYPLLLLVGGLGSEINANFVLAEYLASHGYVVASLSLLGPDERQPDQSRSRESVEATVRDLEFAAPVVCKVVNADCAKLAVAGHSLGAVSAILFANRNPNVSAVIAFDGTFGFKGAGDVLTQAAGYAPREMRAAVLDLRRSEGTQSAELDLSPILAFRYADLALATLPNIHHSDFTSFAILADLYDVPTEQEYDGTGWSRTTGRVGHENAARIALSFLNAEVARGSDEDLGGRLAAAPGSSLRRIEAAPPIPGPDDAVLVAKERGAEALRKLIREACRGSAPSDCVDQGLFNSSGYARMSSDAAEAIVLFETVAWAHPASANAQDSLADGYAAAGRRVEARNASLHAMKLAPGDPALDEQHRREIVEAAERRMQALDAAAVR